MGNDTPKIQDIPPILKSLTKDFCPWVWSNCAWAWLGLFSFVGNLLTAVLMFLIYPFAAAVQFAANHFPCVHRHYWEEFGGTILLLAVVSIPPLVVVALNVR